MLSLPLSDKAQECLPRCPVLSPTYTLQGKKKPLRLVKTYVVLELNFKLHNERLMNKKIPRLETVNNIIKMRV